MEKEKEKICFRCYTDLEQEKELDYPIIVVVVMRIFTNLKL